MDKQSIKYTTDGKKVVVIGGLNQTEKIVQELDCSNIHASKIDASKIKEVWK